MALDRETARKVLDGNASLQSAFVWDETPQGHAFWEERAYGSGLSEEGRAILERIANGGFAVGDRVRAIDETCILNKGSEHVVVKVDDKRLHIEIPPYGALDYPHEYFEHVAAQPQLTIRAGCYYKTRDGRKVGPIASSGDCEWVWETKKKWTMMDGTRAAWREDGSFSPDEDKEHPADLIAEWVDEPAEPKFKVGDAVAYVDGSGTATVLEVYPYGVKVDTHSEYGICTENPKDLRLVAPATSGKRETFTVKDAKFFIGDGNGGWTQISGKKPAIVALIENGQPKPATRPFVHPDRDSAAKEARRLASQHKGKEFGVYELVDTAKEARVYEHEWQRLAVNKKTGDAAKEMRKLTGLSLGDSKRAVERWLGKAA